MSSFMPQARSELPRPDGAAVRALVVDEQPVTGSLSPRDGAGHRTEPAAGTP